MSQYPPSQYPPHQPAYYGQARGDSADLLAPARRAGVTMIVLGVLGVVCGLCLALASFMINSPNFASSPQGQQLQQQFAEMEAQFGVSPQTIFLIAGIIPLAAGALLGAMGFFVRGGGMGSVITSIVLVSLLALALGLIIILGTVQALTGGAGPELFLSICIYAVPLVLLLLVLFWLIQAGRNASKLSLARQQYQAQMWQYQQHQQIYQQQGGAGGMGYTSAQQSQPQYPSPPQAPPTGMAPPHPPAPPFNPPPPQSPSYPADRRDTTDGPPPQG